MKETVEKHCLEPVIHNTMSTVYPQVDDDATDLHLPVIHPC